MRRLAFLIVGSLLVTTASLRPVAAAERERDATEIAVVGKCRVSRADERWIATAVESWKTIRRELIASQEVPKTTALFFDASCVYQADPLILGEGPLHLSAATHAGRIVLPSGAELPARVTSFAAPNGDDSVFFVMSLPSLWETSGRKFAFDMGPFLTAVMIHEISHVVQFRTYLRQSAAVEGIELLGTSVSDDIVQNRFAADESFRASVEEETRLLYAAAAAGSVEESRRLTRRALAMMRSRQARHYVNEQRALAELEDIFLTMEGSGQFAALTWLIHPHGGGLSTTLARREFGETERFWSQRQGLALFLVLDRLVPDWRKTVYGDGRRTVLQLLDEALPSGSSQGAVDDEEDVRVAC